MGFGRDGKINIIIFTRQNLLIWNELKTKLRDTAGRVDDLISNHPFLINSLKRASKGLFRRNHI